MDLSPPKGIANPLIAAANATLKFSVSASGGSVDPVTGNYIPNAATVTVPAYVRESRDNTEYEAGVDQNTIAVVVWLADPTNVANTIKHGSMADAVVDGVKGVLIFDKPQPHPLVKEAIAAGNYPYHTTARFRREN